MTTREDIIWEKISTVIGFESENVDDVYAELEKVADLVHGQVNYNRHHPLKNGKPEDGTITVRLKGMLKCDNYTLEANWSIDTIEKGGKTFYRI